VLAGGGNTSFKDDRFLCVKASGFSLASISEDGFVRMRRDILGRIWEEDYPSERDAREKKALADLNEARHPEDAGKRPSVETLMHDLMPGAFVVHTHPALANGLGCGKRGREAADKLFGEGLLWIPAVDPGYVLARVIRGELSNFRDIRGTDPQLLLLENHGLVVFGDGAEEIHTKHDQIRRKLREAVDRDADFTALRVDARLSDLVRSSVRTAAETAGAAVELPEGGAETLVAADPFRSPETLLRFRSREDFAPVSAPFTPDHIVYCGHAFLHVTGDWALDELAPADMEQISAAVKEAAAAFIRDEGIIPRVVALKGGALCSLGTNEKAAKTAKELFLDSLRIAAYAESFGGSSFLPDDQVSFIRSWEVEKYRSKVSLGGN
jgi:rhamnose utilization protein RhaD (predicted bifunctional aldolase and dehydrogenase)